MSSLVLGATPALVPMWAATVSWVTCGWAVLVGAGDLGWAESVRGAERMQSWEDTDLGGCDLGGQRPGGPELGGHSGKTELGRQSPGQGRTGGPAARVRGVSGPFSQ